MTFRRRPKKTFAALSLATTALVALSIMSCTLGRYPAGPVEIDNAALGKAIDDLFAEFQGPGSPGAAVMVVHRGEVVQARGYGLADLESGEPILPSTPFRLASLSKAFTAMAIVLLAERGELSYNAEAAQWVPELERFDGVTIRHLLTHTSGLPDYYSEKLDVLRVAAEQKEPGQLFAHSDVVSIYDDWGELVFEPGSQFAYSNPGYELLALIIERVSGVSYGTFLQENIFQPLAMKTAVVRDGPAVEIPGRALGYRWDDDEGSWVDNDAHWANWVVGAGGVYASLDDLYRWLQALADGTLVSRETLEEIFSPVELKDGSISPYGFGWGLDEIGGVTAYHHTGAWVGFRTAMAILPESEVAVVVLCNSRADAAVFREAVFDAAFEAS